MPWEAGEEPRDPGRRALRRGPCPARRWVMLKNVHLAPGWLMQLEKKLHSLQPHACFRLFLTMEINPKVGGAAGSAPPPRSRRRRQCR